MGTAKTVCVHVCVESVHVCLWVQVEEGLCTYAYTHANIQLHPRPTARRNAIGEPCVQEGWVRGRTLPIFVQQVGHVRQLCNNPFKASLGGNRLSNRRCRRVQSASSFRPLAAPSSHSSCSLTKLHCKTRLELE